MVKYRHATFALSSMNLELDRPHKPSAKTGGVQRESEGRRHLKAGQPVSWTREEFEAKRMHRLRRPIRYPKPCTLYRETP
jgi:hypothetical protein